MFGIGAQEMVFLAIIALLVFGPKRLPELARTLGRGMAEFRRASADLRGALSLEPDPPGTPRRREKVDPREDRDFDTPAPQVGDPDDDVPDVLKAAEAANAAVLANSALDEAHRATADSTEPAEAAEATGTETEEDDGAQGRLFELESSPIGATPDSAPAPSSDTDTDTDTDPDSPPGTTPVATPGPRRQD